MGDLKKGCHLLGTQDATYQVSSDVVKLPLGCFLSSLLLIYENWCCVNIKIKVCPVSVPDASLGL